MSTTAPAPAVPDRRTTLLATGALLAMTACWGSTFFLIADLLDRVPTLDFLAVRFLVAGVVMLLVAPGALRRLSPASRRHAAVLGLVYGLAQILQTAGLAHTPASVSGFLTGTYVVLTPLLAAVLLRTRTTPVTWTAVAVATVGLGVLTLDGVAMGYGEAITLVSAVLYALHILGLGAWSRPGEALGMSVLQVLVIAAVCLVATAPDGLVLPPTPRDWLSVVYMALFAGALALLGQTWAQARLSATRAALIMSMEPVFAAFFAVLLGEDAVTVRMVLGGSLVVAAMLLVEALPRRAVEGEDAPDPGSRAVVPRAGNPRAGAATRD